MSERLHVPLGLWLKLSDEGRKALRGAIIDVTDLSTSLDAQQRAVLCDTQRDEDEERNWHDGVGLQRTIAENKL